MSFSVHDSVGEIIIGGDKIKFGMGELCIQSVYSIIKIMISNSGSVVFKFAHEFKFQFAAIEIKVWSALKNITCIQQEGIWIFSPDLFYKGCSSCNPAHVWISGIIWVKWFNVTVNIIGMQDSDMF